MNDSSPRLQKGTIFAMDRHGSRTTVIAFQYNPEKLSRTLSMQGGQEGGSQDEAMRLRGAPKETIQMEIEIDAHDQPLSEHPDTATVGIEHQLAALEMLVYPELGQIERNATDLSQGKMSIVPPLAPVALLVWGQRAVPTRVSQFTIQEEAFDPNLNPTNAKVNLTLQVLSYNDLPQGHAARTSFCEYQRSRQNLSVWRQGR